MVQRRNLWESRSRPPFARRTKRIEALSQWLLGVEFQFRQKKAKKIRALALTNWFVGTVSNLHETKEFVGAGARPARCGGTAQIQFGRGCQQSRIRSSETLRSYGFRNRTQ